jgi:hypothetical protein
MSLTASDKGGADFEITPEGQYIGRCFKILDLGTQTTTGQFGIKDQHKVMVSWELLDEPKMQDGRPFSVSQFYTVSLHEKAKLRADLEAWRGRKFTATELEGFDIGSVLGAYCMLQVVHDETGKYANVQTIMSYKGEKPEPVNKNVVFDIDNPDMEVFNALSENMQNKITGTPEWKFNHQEAAKPAPSKATEKEDVVVEDLGDPINIDDIPF